MTTPSALDPLSTLDDGSTGLLIAGETNIQNRADPVSAFAEVRSVFDGADIRFLHLEGPLCEPSDDPANPDIPHKERWRHSDPSMVRALVDADIHAVSCASNVSYPQTAALRSSQVLTEAGIAFCGIGPTLAAARKPAIVDHDGLKIGFLSYTTVFWPSRHAADDTTPGTAVIRAGTAYRPGRRALEMPGAPPEIVTWVDADEIAALTRDVRALKDQVDIAVLSCHWGVSSSPDPTDYQRQIARAAIEAGIDIVVGHHPHVIQPIEFFRGAPIFYSLGNFAFDWPKMRDRHKDGMLLRFDIADGAIRRIRLVPVMRNADNQVTTLDPSTGDGARIVARIRELSGDAIVLTDNRADLDLADPAGARAQPHRDLAQAING